MTPRKKTAKEVEPVALEGTVAPDALAEDTAPEGLQDEFAALVESIDRMVVFHVAKQRYAVPIDSVQEIQQIVAFSEVPSGSSSVLGMVNLRGQVIAALDTRMLMGLPSREFHVDTPMIVCRAHGQLVALVVDEVEDVVSLPDGCMALPPRMHGLSDRMIGVCRMDEGLIYLLDVERMLAATGLSGSGGY